MPFTNPIRSVWIVIATFIGLLSIAVHVSYGVAQQRAEQQVITLVRLVEEHASSTIDRTDLSLQAAIDRLTPADLDRGRTMDDRRRKEIEQILIAIHRRTQGVVSMSLTDADGRVITNSVGTPPGSNLGDRGYFLELKKGPRTKPVVSEAIKGRVSNKWGIQVARRIEFPDGRFAGMLVANLGLSENFEHFYANVNLGPDGLITLRDSESRILVRYPVRHELLGKAVAGTATSTIVDSRGSEGTYRAVSPVDNVERILAIRKLPDHAIYALVGTSTADAFRLWRLELLAALLVASASLLVGWFVTRTLAARFRAEADLRNLNVTLEHRVAERTASLEEAIADLESFSYSASHDLRAPLRAINGFARVLIDEEASQLSTEGRAMLDRIAVNAAKMGMLIDDILDYSRAGRLPLERTAVDIGKLATKIAGELRGNYPHTEIAIGDLPVVLGDATMLRQVFQNLIENACKFSAKQEHPRVEIEATRRGDMVECVIRDNGVGFDPRYAGKMFGMFQRMHLEVDFPGTGVGLAIVDRLISRHGGTIRAESHPGKGATFTFTLLLAD